MNADSFRSGYAAVIAETLVMSPETGEHLMLWTVRASVVCYVIALWRWLFCPVVAESSTRLSAQSGDRIYSATWFAAWLLCVLHVICAFHFRHHWDHAVAIEHTAKMTENVVGIRWGGGLYINYLFLLLWGASALDSLRYGGNRTENRRRLEVFLHAFAAFMMFNATAIFGPAWWWVPTIAVVAVILCRVFTASWVSTGN